MTTPATTGAVLIVDDDAQIRWLLAEYARELGLRTAEADNGASALAEARRSRPDLILLDVAMPQMNGRQFLAHLRADPQLRDVPVIVVSGASDTEVAVSCIEMGAEDFLTKPFQPALLRARIRSSLERARLQAHERLRVLDRAKDDFLRLISHELRTPMTGVMGAADALADPALDGASRADAIEVLRAAVERLHAIVEHALLLTSVRVAGEESSLAPHPLDAALSAARARVSPAAGRRGVTIGPAPAQPDWILCEPGLLADALAALLECAAKFSAEGEAVTIATRREGATVSVLITVTGRGIPQEARGRFFDVLAVREPLTPGGDLGLGPPVAAEVLRLLGGGVSVESHEGGVRFVVTLQAADPAAAGAG